MVAEKNISSFLILEWPLTVICIIYSPQDASDFNVVRFGLNFIRRCKGEKKKKVLEG